MIEQKNGHGKVRVRFFGCAPSLARARRRWPARASGLDDAVGADAGGADVHLLDLAVDDDADVLDVGAERALGVLDDVQTDAALLLGKTAVGDVTADRLVLAAYLANSAHGFPWPPLGGQRCTIMNEKNKGGQWGERGGSAHAP